MLLWEYMKYKVQLLDDEENVVYENWTSIGTVAEDYVYQAREAERMYNIEHQTLEANGKCGVCGTELVNLTESQDIDGNRRVPAWVCPNNH